MGAGSCPRPKERRALASGRSQPDGTTTALSQLSPGHDAIDVHAHTTPRYIAAPTAKRRQGRNRAHIANAASIRVFLKRSTIAARATVALFGKTFTRDSIIAKLFLIARNILRICKRMPGAGCGRAAGSEDEREQTAFARPGRLPCDVICAPSPNKTLHHRTQKKAPGRRPGALAFLKEMHAEVNCSSAANQ
jgi:hypothetical protein